MSRKTSRDPIRIAVLGAGRMGQELFKLVSEDAGLELVGVVARRQPDWLPERHYLPTLETLPATTQVLVDFSLPAGTRKAAAWCSRSGSALVCGVTGLDAEAETSLQQASAHAAVLCAANFSLGINLLAKLLGQVVVSLPEKAQVDILDIHHVHKKDAPSGTALALGSAMERAAPGRLRDIEYHSERHGEVIGRHEVVLGWGDEVLSLRHEARDRRVFAAGALQAAIWLAAKPPGRYRPEDWIGNVSYCRDRG